MVRTTVWVLFSTLIFMCSLTTPSYAAVVSWISADGISRLEASQYKDDFFKLANQFESQHNKVYCGVASTTIVLNALRMYRNNIDIPLDDSLIDEEDLDYFPDDSDFTPFYARYTQNTVVEKSPKPRLMVMGKPPFEGAEPEYGYRLEELEDLMQAHGLETKTVHVESMNNLPQMKQELIKTLAKPNQYIVINYARQIIGQEPGGHISPIGAYHKGSDSFLVMDVTPTKASWIWVGSKQLFKAMATTDAVSQIGQIVATERSVYRGYIIVSDNVAE